MTLTSLPVAELPRLEAWRSKGSTAKIPFDGDGVELFHVASKDFSPMSNSNKPRLLVFHGYPTASFDFHGVFPELEKKFEVLCWDYCGYGFSQKVYKTIQEQVDLLEALLETNGFASKESKLAVHILAHDLGDTLVQELLAREETETCVSVQSVVMLNGGVLPSMHRPTLVQRLMLTPYIGQILQHFISISVFKLSISKVFGPNTQPTDEEVQEFYALGMCNGGDKLLTENIKYMSERVLFHDRWVGALKRYAAERDFLLVDGPVDPVSGRHLAEAVMEQVAGSKVVFLDDNIGHWPQLEAPKETMKAFYDFHTEIGTFKRKAG